MHALRQLRDKIVSYVSPGNDHYQFVLTPTELDKSENQWIQEFKQSNWVFSNPKSENGDKKEEDIGQERKEQKTQKTMRGYTIGSQQIQKDADRDLRINGVNLRGKFLPKDSAKFKEYLLKAFKTNENVTLLDQHFSQQPSYTAINSLVSCAGLVPGETCYFIRPGSLSEAKENHEVTSDLYEKKGEIYYKSTVDRFTVRNKQGEIAGYVPGPMEVFFKLDDQGIDGKEKGFVLQSISTNSSLMHDIVMGVNVTEQRVIAAIQKYSRGMNKIEKLLEKREKEINNWLGNHGITLPIAVDSLYSRDSKIQSKALNLDRIKIAKDIISEYKKGDLSIAETHTILSNLLEKENTPKNFGYLGRFFPAVSTTTSVLKSVLAKLERTTGYKPPPKIIAPQQPSEQRSKGLR